MGLYIIINKCYTLNDTIIQAMTLYISKAHKWKPNYEIKVGFYKRTPKCLDIGHI